MKTTDDVRKEIERLRGVLMRLGDAQEGRLSATISIAVLTWVLNDGPDLSVREWPVVDLRKDEVRR